MGAGAVQVHSKPDRQWGESLRMSYNYRLRVSRDEFKIEEYEL